MSKPAKSDEDKRICPVSAQSPNLGLSRSHVQYWLNRIEKVRAKNGKESTHYSARIVFRGRRVRFPLHTPNKQSAASKAARIYTFVAEHGWDAALTEFKSESVQRKKLSESSSIGDLIAAAAKFSSVRPQTLEEYTKSIRRIAAELFGIPDGRKHDTKDSAGNAAWRSRVDSIKLIELTPDRIQNWKNSRLNDCGRDASARRRAIITTNSLIRNAKSLFSKKLLPFLREELSLPDPLPFAGITLEKSPSMRYRSQIDAQELLAESPALRETDPEAYKIFLLTLVCGLRVSEVDYLLWEAIDLERRILRVENTSYHQLKSEDSAGEIDLSAEVAAIFEDFAEKATGQFVIESDGADERSVATRTYRCQHALDVLKRWLRSQGVTDRKPIHTLRKEVGAILASEQGIFAASRYLRHSDIRITSAVYADKKNRVVPPLSPASNI